MPQVLELGASIIHGANHYMLSLAREMNLTLTEGDDTGAAFSIWDGKDFVMSQVWAVQTGGTTRRYIWAVQTGNTSRLQAVLVAWTVLQRHA